MILGRVIGSIAMINIHLTMGKLLKKYFGPDNKFPLVNAIAVAFWVSGCIFSSFLGNYCTIIILSS